MFWIWRWRKQSQYHWCIEIGCEQRILRQVIWPNWPTMNVMQIEFNMSTQSIVSMKLFNLKIKETSAMYIFPFNGCIAIGTLITSHNVIAGLVMYCCMAKLMKSWYYQVYMIQFYSIIKRRFIWWCEIIYKPVIEFMVQLQSVLIIHCTIVRCLTWTLLEIMWLHCLDLSSTETDNKYIDILYHRESCCNLFIDVDSHNSYCFVSNGEVAFNTIDVYNVVVCFFINIHFIILYIKRTKQKRETK